MKTIARIRLLEANAHAADVSTPVFALPNDTDPLAHAVEIAGAARVDLHFPAFVDERAYSQAYLVRRRLRFKGDLRAIGEVLADQLLQMERTGFSSAVVGAMTTTEDAQRQLESFTAFYHGDVVREAPNRYPGVGKSPHAASALPAPTAKG